MYECQICKRQLRSIRGYCFHQSFHKNIPNAVFHCPVTECLRSCASYAALQTHITRVHRVDRLGLINTSSAPTGQNVNGTDNNGNLACDMQNCSQNFEDSGSLIAHLKYHLRSESVEIRCPLERCFKTFKILSTFSSHLVRKHDGFLWKKHTTSTVSSPADQELSTENVSILDESELHEPAEQDTNENFLFDFNGNIDEEINCDQYRDSLSESFALFLLKLQAKFLVPQSTIQFILSEVSGLYFSGWLYNHSRLSEKLSNMGLDLNTVKTAISELEQDDIFKQFTDTNSGPFKSSYKRLAYYKSQFKFEIGRNDTGPHYGYNIPLQENINHLLNDNSVLTQYSTPIINENQNELHDIHDGSYFKSNDFLNDKVNIHLMLYQDAFEIVNPIGSAKCKHKMIGVYYTLANLYPWHRSKIDTIQLATLCYEKDLSFFGAEAVFRLLVNDCKKFESEGVHITNMNNNPVRGTIVTCLGDNLGSHMIGGFVENFSGDTWCRYCYYSKKDEVNEPKVIRTISSYEKDINHLQNNPTFKVFKGIKHTSILNELSHFHVIGGFPPCIGHDIFEGVVSYDLQLFVDYFVKSKYLTYDIINHQLKVFGFKQNDAKDRPSPIKPNKTKLAGNVVQLWCLLRLFPVIFGNYILKTNNIDEVWDLLISLKTLVELICAQSYSLGQVTYMEDNINSYISNRLRLFPNSSLKPKHHFMMHYPNLTVKFGPLIKLWTMRMESKHSYFKRCVRRSQNFKNIGHTLSEQHQLLQAFSGSGNMFGTNFSYQNSQPYEEYNFDHNIHVLLNHDLDLSKSATCEQIDFYGVIYKKDNILLFLDTSEGLKAGQVMCFLINDEVPYCLVKIFETEYLFQYGCYKLIPVYFPREFKLFKFSQTIFDFYPLPYYDLFGCKVIVLKHSLLNKM